MMLRRLVRQRAVARPHLVVEVPGAVALRTRELQLFHAVDVRPGPATTEIDQRRIQPAPARVHSGVPHQPPPMWPEKDSIPSRRDGDTPDEDARLPCRWCADEPVRPGQPLAVPGGGSIGRTQGTPPGGSVSLMSQPGPAGVSSFRDTGPAKAVSDGMRLSDGSRCHPAWSNSFWTWARGRSRPAVRLQRKCCTVAVGLAPGPAPSTSVCR